MSSRQVGLQQPSGYDVVSVLRNMGRRISQLEEDVHLMTKGPLPTAVVQRRPGFWERVLDPPCVVCGRWTADEICTTCRQRFPWMA